MKATFQVNVFCVLQLQSQRAGAHYTLNPEGRNPVEGSLLPDPSGSAIPFSTGTHVMGPKRLKN